MKYELTREQISHIFHLGQVWSKDSINGKEKVDFYLNSLLKENDNPQIGEVFLFEGKKYKCEMASKAKMAQACFGCSFMDNCTIDAPKCVAPNRIFKLIEE